MPHDHPDSVMLTISGFRRRLHQCDSSVDVTLEPGQVRWLEAQEHAGENIGETATHVIFVELKGAAAEARGEARLGPVES